MKVKILLIALVGIVLAPRTQAMEFQAYKQASKPAQAAQETQEATARNKFLRRIRAPLMAVATGVTAISCGVVAFFVTDPDTQQRLRIAAVTLSGVSCSYAAYKLRQRCKNVYKEEFKKVQELAAHENNMMPMNEPLLLEEIERDADKARHLDAILVIQ
jgi:hypothetical protein